MVNKIKHIYKYVMEDSLYANSIYLMLSTAVMAGLGFIFWIINARFFSPHDVGVATTLISVLTLISGFSILGLNNGIVRFLPNSDRKVLKINTSFTVVTAVSIIIAIIYVIFVNLLSPELSFLKNNLLLTITFILFTIFSSLNTISDNVFIAYRASKYILIKNTVLSIVKLLLPFVLIGFGAYGIFTSIGIALIAAFTVSIIVLYLKFQYFLQPTISRDVIKRIFRFSLGNYLAGFIGGLPTMLLPIIITNKLGAEHTAYYYMPMTITSFLYIIPQATTKSLFAEGSYDEKDLKKFINKSIFLNSLLLLPAMMLVYFFGKYILLVFGVNYAQEGTKFLQLLAISGTLIYINSVGGVLLNIKHHIKKLIAINVISATLILSLSYILISQKLQGIGIAWLITQFLISPIYFILNKNYQK